MDDMETFLDASFRPLPVRFNCTEDWNWRPKNPPCAHVHLQLLTSSQTFSYSRVYYSGLSMIHRCLFFTYYPLKISGHKTTEAKWLEEDPFRAPVVQTWCHGQRISMSVKWLLIIYLYVSSHIISFLGCFIKFLDQVLSRRADLFDVAYRREYWSNRLLGLVMVVDYRHGLSFWKNFTVMEPLTDEIK